MESLDPFPTYRIGIDVSVRVAGGWAGRNQVPDNLVFWLGSTARDPQKHRKQQESLQHADHIRVNPIRINESRYRRAKRVYATDRDAVIAFN